MVMQLASTLTPQGSCGSSVYHLGIGGPGLIPFYQVYHLGIGGARTTKPSTFTAQFTIRDRGARTLPTLACLNAS